MKLIARVAPITTLGLRGRKGSRFANLFAPSPVGFHDKQRNLIIYDVLINMARGLIVDEGALAKALKEKWIAGAGIDVYGHLDVFKEPQGPIESPFFGLENVILTPHVGAVSVEAFDESHKKGIAEVKGILQGLWPQNCVNPHVKPWFDINRPG